MKKVTIETNYIKLNQFLKLINIIETGGHGKILIQEGRVKVNNEICLERGRKIYKGDRIKILDYGEYIVD